MFLSPSSSRLYSVFYYDSIPSSGKLRQKCDRQLLVGEQEIWPVNGSLDVLRSTFTNSIWNTSPTVTFKVQLSWHKPLFMAYSNISLWKRHKHGQLQKEAQHTRDVNTYDLQTLCYARAKAHVCHFLGSTKQDSGVQFLHQFSLHGIFLALGFFLQFVMDYITMICTLTFFVVLHFFPFFVKRLCLLH